ncbi:DNA mismatch repair protein MutS [Alkaliphilus hydrothermalis]|uniref:DNA mismatch repair protein MutS n=1 Tax=Alkaliphilus hydrothermalis TaxID=1482730 RepID=A0ABS2NLN1_9FIRM|nr:DNA mismatch repair protein MutS [Alkaliphilus hydrothermalis]MBM7613844.1 DNA mismatch repair protein MutS [Alkaliphilus hydrothermalis]
MKKLTPMMQQYMDIKNKYQDTLLLFRLGDFYELFFEDALTAARELEITLTARDCGLEERAPMCGVPHHSVDSYIDRLIAKGYKVAICDQVEDASQAVGIVKRDVVRIITPGTIMDTSLLDEKRNNYLMSLYGEGEGWGLAYVDISTGELFTTEIKGTSLSLRLKLLDEIGKVQPKEIIYYIDPEKVEDIAGLALDKKFNLVIHPQPHWCYGIDYATGQLKNQFNVMALDGLGFHGDHLGVNATGGLIDYLSTTQKRFLSHINKINVYHVSETMVMDLTTRNNLELTETIRSRSKKGSLLWVLDKTQTAMGGRMLRKWVEEPLLNSVKINQRLDAVQALLEDLLLRQDLKDYLKSIYDLERLAARISYGSANPRDLVALCNSIQHLPAIKELLGDKKGLIQALYDRIDCLEDIGELIQRAIVEEPPVTLKEGGIIKEGFHPEVDELLWASMEGKQWIATLEGEEKEKTGIKNLKVGFNKVFGYYLEVTKSNLKLVPESYQRKQTLANCERYITPELKEMESKILGAEEKVVALEHQLFLEVRDQIAKDVQRIQKTASAIAELDTIYSLAEVAAENQYIKPTVNQEGKINIKDGRHPVVEKMLDNEMFITNDTRLDHKNHQISIITGPNMAGKSTYMRQVAVIVLMAQIGSFIPASEATIGIVDRIFTRVGASDDLSQGQSTFMVEMSEMANILNSATANSLLILDEIGRGTSTFDGLSIAWSVVEYISHNVKSQTLFSTHYHELTELEGKIDGVKNYRISVKEEGENIIFLRKVVEGSADKSYGIQVARLAGLPLDVIERAKDILRQLEENDIAKVEIEANALVKEEIAPAVEVPIQVEEPPTIKEATIIKEAPPAVAPQQMDFAGMLQDALLQELKEINLLNTTPIEALNLLAKLQKKATELPQGGK